MTLDELRDAHAKRLGWKPNPLGGWDSPIDSSQDQIVHPVPATLDAIAGLMPPGWWWLKEAEDGEPVYWYGFHSRHSYISVRDTGDELTDRARLAWLAWEAEAKGAK